MDVCGPIKESAFRLRVDTTCPLHSETLDAMQDVDPEEEYILVIDADMIMRSPFFPKAMGVAPGSLQPTLASKHTCRLSLPVFYN